jgi:hypothetical protein
VVVNVVKREPQATAVVDLQERRRSSVQFIVVGSVVVLDGELQCLGDRGDMPAAMIWNLR